MSRRRPDHAADMHERGDRSRLRSRRRRRRLVRGFVKTVFWVLVLSGVFVLGLGYGRTISADDELSKDEVTIERDSGTVEATLPTRTVTVTKTVTVKAPAKKKTTTPAPNA